MSSRFRCSCEKVHEGPVEPVPSKSDGGADEKDGGKLGDALPADPLAPLPELGGDVPDPEEHEGEDGGFSEDQKKLGEKLNKKWREHMEEATAPFKIQNVTLFEPLGSRSTSELLPALDRVWVRFRALGIPMVRLHSDRAKEMLAKPVRAWAGRRGLYQTFTSGDDAPANGRIESEILQFKRRLRLTLQSSAAKTEEWPSVARHSSEERLRAQLQKVGLRQHAMLPYNVRVLVKTKLWHKRFTQGMASPYFQATLKGPTC